MMNISGCLTPGLKLKLGFDLDRINIERVDPERQEFFRRLLRNRQVLYDWGLGMFFTLATPFAVEYYEYKGHHDVRVLEKTDRRPVKPNRFVECPGEMGFYETLRPYGNPGFTPADQILALLISGVEVELCDCEEYGPEDPESFLEDLKEAADIIRFPVPFETSLYAVSDAVRSLMRSGLEIAGVAGSIFRYREVRP